MPNYTGNGSTAPIAPDLGQMPEAGPVLDLPADGELADAASVNQALQVLANHSAFHGKPRARASQWNERIRSHISARGHRMFDVDHFGMPGGRVHVYEEEFNMYWAEIADTGLDPFALGRANTYATGTTGYAPMADWSYFTKKSVVNSTKVIDIGFPTASAGFGNRAFGRVLYLKPLFNLTDTSVVYRIPSFAPAAGVIAELEFDALLDAVGAGGGSEEALGLINDYNFVNSIGEGAYFRRQGAETTWRAVTRTTGGATTVVDTGVTMSATAFQRMRIVLVGADADDASAARALFYINEAQVANITTTLPVAALGPYFGSLCTNAAGTTGVRIGLPLRLSHNTALVT